MERITRNLRDLTADERSTIERLLGHPLRDDQQVIIQVTSAAGSKPEPLPTGDQLPDWCNVCEGMTDEDIAELDKSIVRYRGTRPTD